MKTNKRKRKIPKLYGNRNACKRPEDRRTSGKRIAADVGALRDRIQALLKPGQMMSGFIRDALEAHCRFLEHPSNATDLEDTSNAEEKS